MIHLKQRNIETLMFMLKGETIMIQENQTRMATEVKIVLDFLRINGRVWLSRKELQSKKYKIYSEDSDYAEWQRAAGPVGHEAGRKGKLRQD